MSKHIINLLVPKVRKDCLTNNKKDMKNIIFDLDLTLVDTTCLENARHARNWGEAYRLIPQTNLYDGIGSVLDIIKKNNINTTIVSSSPRSYVEKIVNYYDIPAKWIVSYHDAKPIKPHPAQMLMALQLMQVSAKDTISFGDRAIDIAASNAAGIESVACLWGTKERCALLSSSYNHIIIKPQEILTLIR